MTIHSFSQTFNVSLVLTVFRWSLEVVTKYVCVPLVPMETKFYTYQIYFMIFIKKINANRSDWPRPILLLSSGQAQAIKSLFIYSILYVVYIILISKCQYCCMIINIVQHKIQQQSRLLVKLYKFVSFPLFSFVSLQIQLEKQKQDTGSSITLGNTMFTCLPNDTNFMPRIMVRIVGRSN